MSLRICADCGEQFLAVGKELSCDDCNPQLVKRTRAALPEKATGEMQVKPYDKKSKIQNRRDQRKRVRGEKESYAV